VTYDVLIEDAYVQERDEVIDIGIGDGIRQKIAADTFESATGTLSNIGSDRTMAMAYISHDISTVSHIWDRINVMYLGRTVESAPTRETLPEPKHPSTRAQIHAG